MATIKHNQEIQQPHVVAAEHFVPEIEKTKEEQKKKRSWREIWAEKTTGEKAYEVTQFIFGKVFIIAVTAVIAFIAHPGYESPKKMMGIPLGPVPKWMKGFQTWAHDKMLNNKILPMRGNPSTERIAMITSFVLLTSHGGNAFAPFIHWLENGKESISQFFNRLIGKPGEVEKAHERLKDEPKQSWWDTIKGRAITFPLNFIAIISLDAAINKVFGKHSSGHYYFDAYEEKFARLFSGLSKTGKEIAKVPIKEVLTETQAANKWYRFGKVIALDVYFTSVALALWTAISRLSAKKRHEKKERAVHQRIVDGQESGQSVTNTIITDHEPPAKLHVTANLKTEKFSPLASFSELATQDPTNLAMAR